MPEKVLVADDDEDNRRIMELTLARAGYRVVLATNGSEAVAAAEREIPDLILLDLSMPVMTGWDALKKLKSDERLKAIPVLAFTAHAMAGDERRALEAGFDGYLSKPCVPRRAVAAVAAVLAGARLRKASASPAPPVILVVDDSETNRLLIAATLRNSGYRILQAEDGTSGLDMIGRENPGLVILDLMMPGMDGAEMMRRLTATDGTARPRVLLMTAQNESESEAKARALGADAHLAKPFVPQTLRARVRELLASPKT